MKIYTATNEDKPTKVLLELSKDEARVVHDAVAAYASRFTKRSQAYKLKERMDDQLNVY